MNNQHFRGFLRLFWVFYCCFFFSDFFSSSELRVLPSSRDEPEACHSGNCSAINSLLSSKPRARHLTHSLAPFSLHNRPCGWSRRKARCLLTYLPSVCPIVAVDAIGGRKEATAEESEWSARRCNLSLSQPGHCTWSSFFRDLWTRRRDQCSCTITASEAAVWTERQTDRQDWTSDL